MLDRIRDFLQCLLLLSVVCITGCSCGPSFDPGETSDSSSSSGTGGAGGGDLGPCGVDCSAIPTPPCAVSECNTGQALGPLNTCVVVAAPAGTACEDGKFCTTGDACDGGVCVGGTTTNDCGVPHGPCDAVLCNEAEKTCGVSPVNDGTPCTPLDLCEINGVCELGQCHGEPKTCALSPLLECNKVECEPATGQCVGTPDPFKDNAPCVLTGDLCKVNKTCQNGLCAAGVPMDCSGLDVECQVGECDTATGICGPVDAPAGKACTDGIDQCEVGECNANGGCKSAAAPNGTACNDHDACTSGDQCAGGSCADGAAVAGCQHYFKEGFEDCPNGWALAGDWECGLPMTVGPPAAHTGLGVLATNLDGVYSVNQSFTNATATSPPIDLTTATNPIVSFWAWDHTEGGTFDGWHLKISTNGGTSFTTVTTVTPAYSLNLGTPSQPAWGGDHSAQGWQSYSADLTAFAGQTVLLRFAFRSDGATVYPGVYIDDLVVDEPLQIPLYITTPSPLGDVYAAMPASIPLARIGGASSAVWSIVPGGVNTDWLTINPSTGELGGTPLVTDVGPVSVTVRVAEPTLPSNFDEKTFTFDVVYDAYYTSFEGACPAGWTLTGDWECGVPTVVGPSAAYDGAQCIATQIDGNYTSLQSFTGATATSPDIDLSASPFPVVTFRMWMDTEGSTHDGVNLKISIDGGMTYSIVDTVTPAYPLTIDGEPAWGGHQSGLGWQLMQADLAPYSGQTIRLRFSFRSDSSQNYPGVYIDDLFVN